MSKKYILGINSNGNLGFVLADADHTVNGFMPPNKAWLTATGEFSVAKPTFDPAAGTKNNPLNVAINCATPGATIYYTTDGTDPTTSETRIEYTGPLFIDKTTTVKAVAYKEDPLFNSNYSAVVSAKYTLKVATPTFDPVAGNYPNAQTVTISCATQGATIYYTLDGSAPTNKKTLYTGPITISQDVTIKAIAYKSPMSSSAVGTAQYRFSTLTATPETQTINDNGGEFTVVGSILGTDNLGVTCTNNDFVPSLSATVGTVTNNNTTDDNGPYWYFTPNEEGSVDGTINVTYQGRALKESSTINIANEQISTSVHVDYVPDIYIVGNYGNSGWNWSSYGNGDKMNQNDGIYTATINVPANSYIMFARKTGEEYGWDNDYDRLFFGAKTDGGNWVCNGNYPGGDLELNPSDNGHIKYSPIEFPTAGTYIVTINANNNTFTISGVQALTLAEIEKNGTVNNAYTVSDELTGAWYVKYTDGNGTVHPLLFAKDQANATNGPTVNTPTFADADQMDYVKDIVGWQDNDWDQSNWVIFDFKDIPNGETAAKDLVDHKITPSTITGTYSDNNNYTIVLQGQAPTASGSQLSKYLGYMGSVDGMNPYSGVYAGALYNTYVTANFLPSNLSGFEATTGPHAGDKLFFVNPKVAEVALVYGVWAGNDVFTVYQTDIDNNINAWGVPGAVSANWMYNRLSTDEADLGKPSDLDQHVDDAYFFHALVSKIQSTSLRSQGTADGNSPVSDAYSIYPLDMPREAGNWTAVREVSVARDVESVRYYNIMGMESDKPFDGLNIVVTRYTDGTTSATKVLR